MYTICETVIETEDHDHRKLYGIMCENRRIDGVTPDRRKMERLVELCSRLELSPIHMDNVVEDFLND